MVDGEAADNHDSTGAAVHCTFPLLYRVGGSINGKSHELNMAWFSKMLNTIIIFKIGKLEVIVVLCAM